MNIVTKKNAYLTPTLTLGPHDLPDSRHAVGHTVVDGRTIRSSGEEWKSLSCEESQARGAIIVAVALHKLPVDRLHVQHIQHEAVDLLLVVVSTIDVIPEVTGQVSTTHLHFPLTFPNVNLTSMPSPASTGHGPRSAYAHNEGIYTPKVSFNAIRNASR
jgi:hypothetical protein